MANLPYGQQKILEFASLMVMNPDPVLYMLDEPFAGLTRTEVNSYLSLMRERREKGSTFLLVEHNMRAVMDICDRIVVLDHGEKIAEGSPGGDPGEPKGGGGLSRTWRHRLKSAGFGVATEKSPSSRMYL